MRKSIYCFTAVFLLSMFAKAGETVRLDCVFPYSIVLEKIGDAWIPRVHIYACDSHKENLPRILFGFEGLKPESMNDTDVQSKVVEEITTLNTLLGSKYFSQWGEQGRSIGGDQWCANNYGVQIPYRKPIDFVQDNQSKLKFSNAYGPVSIVDLQELFFLEKQEVFGSFQNILLVGYLECLQNKFKHQKWQEVQLDKDQFLGALSLFDEFQARNRDADSDIEDSDQEECAQEVLKKAQIKINDQQMQIVNFEYEIFEKARGGEINELIQAYSDKCTESLQSEDDQNSFVGMLKEKYATHFGANKFIFFKKEGQENSFIAVICQVVVDSRGCSCTVNEEGKIITQTEPLNLLSEPDGTNLGVLHMFEFETEKVKDF